MVRSSQQYPLPLGALPAFHNGLVVARPAAASSNSCFAMAPARSEQSKVSWVLRPARADRGHLSSGASTRRLTAVPWQHERKGPLSVPLGRSPFQTAIPWYASVVPFLLARVRQDPAAGTRIEPAVQDQDQGPICCQAAKRESDRRLKPG